MRAVRVTSGTAVLTATAALLGWLLVSGTSLAQSAPGDQVDPKDPTAVATAGMESMSFLVTEETYKDLGFESVDEIHKARLGTSIAVHMIRFDELKAYDPAGDPKALIHDMKEKIYPVFVGGGVRTAIVVRQGDDGNWQMVSLGSPETVRLLDSVRATHGKGTEYMLVKIPAMYQMFLAFTDGKGQVHLITIHEHEKLGIQRGSARPVRTVVELLNRLAQDFEPLQEPTDETH